MGDNHSDKDRGDDAAGNGRGGNASSCGDGLRFECYSKEQGSGTGVSMHTGKLKLASVVSVGT